MSSLGDPIRRRTSSEDLLRTVINEILELKNRSSGSKVPPKTIFTMILDKLELSHTEPTLSFTTSGTNTYDGATALYEFSEYS